MPSIINMEQITSDPYTTTDKPQNTSTTVLPSVSPDTKSAVPHKLTYIHMYTCAHNKNVYESADLWPYSSQPVNGA